MGIDYKNIGRFVRAYRAVEIGRKVRRGYIEVDSVVKQKIEKIDRALDIEDTAERVAAERVRAQDVHFIARETLNGAPKVYRFVKRHIKKVKD